MRAVIKVDVPDFQIGSKVSIYFPDTMTITANVDKMSTGHWIEMGQNRDKTHNVICSECKAGFKFRGHANSIYTQMKHRFCAHCGAKMEVNSENDSTGKASS